ncbi:MAG TPA: acyl carrier protein [Flexilinea sp.]|nr:acyl carrier protein [Flexilinea sp.]HPS47365.1 acyl carrier protein [Flexilinea sp.]
MTDLEKIQSIMRDIFDDETLEIDESTSAEDIAEWDSFSNIQLIAAAEQHFAVKFTTQEAIHIRTVGDILNLIKQKRLPVDKS